MTFIRNSFGNSCLTMQKLSIQFKQIQTNKNVPLKRIAHKDVKSKLQFQFGEKLLFYQESRTQFAFVYPRSVQIKVNESSRFFMNIKEKATKTDEIIREDVVISFSSFSRWPPYLEEIDIKRVVIPALW